ncbi:MAG: ACT domain-containing protein [Planctomycetaceae bacterium]|nr:hypothetical protein [Planctomycetaceae bacterium]
MKVMQLSVFLENKPGELSRPCKALSQAGVNLLSVCLADTAQFGILRMIVPDPDTAKAALEAAGYVVNLAQVIAVDMSDRPGSLTAITTMLGQASINIEYLYAFCSRIAGNAVLVMRFEDPDAAISVLQSHSVRVLKAKELLDRVQEH